MPRPKSAATLQRELVASLERQLAERRAFTWSDPVAPDLPVPGRSDDRREYSEGWEMWVGDVTRPWFQVGPAWSENYTHGSGPYKPNRGWAEGSQGGRELYSSRLLALAGARGKLVQQFAEILAHLDSQIAKEIKKEEP